MSHGTPVSHGTPMPPCGFSNLQAAGVPGDPPKKASMLLPCNTASVSVHACSTPVCLHRAARAPAEHLCLGPFSSTAPRARPCLHLYPFVCTYSSATRRG